MNVKWVCTRIGISRYTYTHHTLRMCMYNVIIPIRVMAMYQVLKRLKI